MGNFIRTVLLVYMEMICCELFVDIFAEKKRRFCIGITGVLYCFVCICHTFLVQLFREYQICKLVSVISVFTIFLIIRFRINILKCILAVCGYMSIVLACDLTFMMLWEKLFIWRWNGADYGEIYITLLTIMTKIVEFILFAWLNRRFSRNRVLGALDSKGWTRFIILSLFSIIALFILWADDGYDEYTVVVLAFGMMLINVMFYFTMWDIAQSAIKKQEYQLIQEKARGQLRIYENMESIYGQQRKKVHEFKNHIGCIQGLLKEGEQQAALHYVNTIQNKLGQWDSPVKTGNSIVDTVINLKYGQAVKQHITLVMKLDKLEVFPLENEDTVILLSNLLDNALEACEKIENEQERIIKFKLVKKKEKYILVVSNRINNEIVVKGRTLETTKKNKQEHGIGMHNVQEIIDKYHMDGECRCEEGWFTYIIIF